MCWPWWQSVWWTSRWRLYCWHCFTNWSVVLSCDIFLLTWLDFMLWTQPYLLTAGALVVVFIFTAWCICKRGLDCWNFVCLSIVCIVTKWKKLLTVYSRSTTWKGSLSIFCNNNGWSEVSSTSNFGPKWPRLQKNVQLQQMFARDSSAIRASERFQVYY